MTTWRDLYCGELRADHVRRTVTAAGWVARRRDHGGLIFIDLRDHTGIVQLVINPERSPEAAKVAHEIRSEFVVRARGDVVRRAPEAVNSNLPTGEVEIQVDELEILARSEPLPFQLDDEGVEESLRLRYRYLDLELAFPTREEVLEVLERVTVATFEALGRTPPTRPLPRMGYAEAMLRYGSDKPDVRFGLEIQEATEVTRGSEFGVFAGAETVRFLAAPKAYSRAELQRLEDVAKEWGAKGLAYLVADDSGEVRSPIAQLL